MSTLIDKLEQELWSACVVQRAAENPETVARWQTDEYSHLRERFVVQPLPAKLNELVHGAVIQWQKIEEDICSSLSMSSDTFLKEFIKAREDYLNKGKEWNKTVVSFGSKVHGAVRNMDWVNLFSWVLPGAAKEDAERYRSIGRMVTAIYYIETISKHGGDYENDSIKKIEARWRMVNETSKTKPRILAFTSGPQDWKALLADPDRHWKPGYSAHTLAHSWESADGFPSEVALPFSQTSEPILANLTPLLAVPEFKVPLPGGVRASQNDIFVLARSSSGPVTIMVEGKVNESFGPTLDEWRSSASVESGKEERLRFLLSKLGLDTEPAGSIRYQLLHRAASAIITGEQYRAVAAILLVHSFSKAQVGLSDYQAFTQLFGVKAALGDVQRLGKNSIVPLFGVWVFGTPQF